MIYLLIQQTLNYFIYLSSIFYENVVEKRISQLNYKKTIEIILYGVSRFDIKKKTNYRLVKHEKANNSMV